MAGPTFREVHSIDVPLTNISIAQRNLETAFVGTKVFPLVFTGKSNDAYYIFDDDWFRDEAKALSDGAVVPTADYGLTTATYAAKEYAMGQFVTDRTRRNADPAVDPDADAVDFVTNKVLLGVERAIASAVLDGSWTTTATLNNGAWTSDASDPISDVEDNKDAVLNLVGMEPNVLVMNNTIWTALKKHPDLLDRVKYVQRGVLTVELVASLFDIENIIVAKAVYDSALEGATSSKGQIWADSSGNNDAWLGFVTQRPSLRRPTAGYTFVASELHISKYPVPERRGDKVEALWEVAPELTLAGAGAILPAVA